MKRKGEQNRHTYAQPSCGVTYTLSSREARKVCQKGDLTSVISYFLFGGGRIESWTRICRG